MAGSFALNTAAHPGVNHIVFAGRNGTEIKLTGTPQAITDPVNAATARALVKLGGTKFVVES